MLPYLAPWPRGPQDKLPESGCCIYCGRSRPEVLLTDEHIIPDGLGGDLLYPDASCQPCANKTRHFETHFITGAMQYPRGVVGVRSRKRPKKDIVIDLQPEGEPEPKAYPLRQDAPFFMFLPVSEDMPGRLNGRVGPAPMMRLAAFGQKDWNAVGQRFAGGNATIRSSHRQHPGLIGQSFAKIAYAYACAKLGYGDFEPFVLDYINAHEPPFDADHVGIYSSHGKHEALHVLSLGTARAPRQTVLGWATETVLVVSIRLFANREGPTVLVVVGKPNGRQLPPLEPLLG